jgi:hypothetical protein
MDSNYRFRASMATLSRGRRADPLWDRWFADSPLEEAGFELLVPLATETTSEYPGLAKSASARGGPKDVMERAARKWQLRRCM